MSISIPGADYTPQLSGYTGQGAFRFWCQKVLPIVYDDSLSYYELLNKVVSYLNNVISDVATVEDNVGLLNESYASLQAYVNEHMQEIVDVVNQYTEFTETYFDNLDVQAEIDNKLDEMASDGSLSRLIGPIVVTTAPNVITEWLNEHITPTTPIVDNTLTIAGAAADAKATGDAIKELSTSFDYNLPLFNLMPIKAASTTVLGVNLTYSGGVLTPTGTASGAGGRLIHVIDFSLDAGTYNLSVYGGTMPLVLQKAEDNTIVAQVDANYATNATFSLDEKTALFIGVNLENGRTYSQAVNISLVSGTTAGAFYPAGKRDVIDPVARSNSEIALADIQNLNDRTMISINLSGEAAETGKLINSNNGAELTNQGNVYAATGFIDVSAFSGLLCSIRSLFGSWFGVAFYNAGKTFVSGIGTSQSGTTADSVATINVTIPENATFIRFSMRNNISPTVSDYPIICTSPLFDFINNKVKTNNIAETENYFSSLSLFEKIGVCGDSFASGDIHDGNTTRMYYNLSWPQIIGRECGVSVYNYSVSGYSTRTFLTSDTRGLPKLLSDEPQDLYIMAFGLNDINIENYIGSIADITADYHNNPDTFYGNYGRIIEQVQDHAPNAKIILSTMARKFSNTAYTAFDDAIVEIAEYYNIPCMRVTEDPFFNSSFFQAGLVNYHPTGILYAGMAKAYQRLFSKSTIDYASYYADYVTP